MPGTNGQLLHDSIYDMSGTGKFIETVSRFEITRSWPEGDGELLLNEDRISVWKEKVLEMDGSDGCTTR